MQNRELLIFIPTYNEKGNIKEMHRRLRCLDQKADILFLDDNSPDGTGRIADEIAKNDAGVKVTHRPGKQGIGSAHQEGITFAYARGYKTLITMDCDFLHNPNEISNLLNIDDKYTVVVGSRFIQKGSLDDWDLFRTALSTLANVMTRRLLRIPYDATGAFRLYRLDRIDPRLFGLVESNDYAFFFESMFILMAGGVRICEVPIVLSKRTCGESKMKVSNMLQSVQRLFSLYFRLILRKQHFKHKPAIYN